jgi:hypothetical protein
MTADSGSYEAVSPARAFLRRQLPVSPVTRQREHPADDRLLRVLHSILQPILHPPRSVTRSKSWR